MSSYNAATVTFLRDVSCTYRMLPKPPTSVTVSKGDRIGNVMGHTSGVEVFETSKTTVTLYLRGDSTEVWVGVPVDALSIEKFT